MYTHIVFPPLHPSDCVLADSGH